MTTPVQFVDDILENLNGAPAAPFKNGNLHGQREEDEGDDDENENEDDGENEDEEDDGDATGKKHKPRTKSNTPPPSTQEGFYPPTWVRVLNHSKDALAVHLLTTDLFPQQEFFRETLLGCLTEAIVYFENEHGLVLDSWYWEHYKESMITILWNNVATIRSRFRMAAREVVKVDFQARIFQELGEARECF
ncbi:hypothetical protein DFH09DRAFT_1073397 [Mycena vulgaris]|nr:hypothetical protein DFH09DRAFT_1073397 [Mycena vulgaris]